MTQDQLIDFARMVAKKHCSYLRLLRKEEFIRIDFKDMEQEAIVFVLGLSTIPDEKELTRLIRNHLQRAVRKELRFDTCLTVPVDDMEEEDPDPFVDPADRAGMTEVLSAVDDLPPPQKAVILGTLAGESVVELCDMLSSSANSVYQYRCRGIQSLRSILGVA